MKILTQTFTGYTLNELTVLLVICMLFVKILSVLSTVYLIEYVTMWGIVRAVNVIVMRDTVVKCVNATIGTALTTTEAYVAVSHLNDKHMYKW